MSVKDVYAYYDEISKQRDEMLQEIKDFEQEAQKGMIEPERLDAIKESIQPLLRNYERISYIMYLLKKPVKKSKHKVYEKQNRKFISKLKSDNSIEATLKENDNVLKNMKKLSK